MTKQKPVHKVRLGTLAVTIWKNESDKGPWYSITPARRYKQGDEWKDAANLGFEDLLPMAKLLDEAHSWIMNQPQADPRSQEPADPAAA